MVADVTGTAYVSNQKLTNHFSLRKSNSRIKGDRIRSDKYVEVDPISAKLVIRSSQSPETHVAHFDVVINHVAM